jgi:lipopolysaccharide transport system permease protein
LLHLPHLIREIYRFRELVRAFMGRELRARYRGSLLGPGWMLLQPLLYLGVYFVVFAQMFDVRGLAAPATQDPLAAEALHRNARAYGAMTMLCGLIPWIALSETVMRGTACLLESGNLIKKFAFPSELIPVHLVGVSLINTLIPLVVLVPAVWLTVGFLPHDLHLLPIALLLQGIFTLGVVYILSSVTVFLRDLGQLVPMLITFAFFLSPIFYARAPAKEFEWVIFANPISYLIDLYRAVFVRTQGALSPGYDLNEEIAILAVIAFTVCFLGLALFMRLKPRFADEI